VSGRFDVVVVGAGPAGSTAALVLARSGVRVALADKAAFPRDKACGDLVGPRGVQVLADLGLRVPDAGQGSDLLAVGPSGRRSRLPAFTGQTYPGHGIIVPRLALDHALREAALQAGAVPLRARVTAVEAGADGRVDAVISSDGQRLAGAIPVRARITAVETGQEGRVDAIVAGDGQRLAGDVVIAADGALSPVARLAGMLDPQAALWGFAIRAYVPAEVPLPLLVLLDASPWRIYPGYGWLFPGAGGQANVGIGVGLGSNRGQAPLRGDLARLVTLLGQRGDLGADAQPGPVMGGWLRMGGTGTPPAAGNVLLTGDAAGLINPLQGEGIGPAMVSGRLAAEAVLAGPARAAQAYAEAIEAAFGQYMTGAAAFQRTLLRRPRATSAVTRLLTAPAVRRVFAGTWSIYWNDLADGARPRPSAWTARAVQVLAARLAGNKSGQPLHMEETPGNANNHGTERRLSK
jgi:geranylgeranyl reductase family protein